MRTLLVILALTGCSHDNSAVDAAVPMDMAPPDVRLPDAMPDATPVTLDCTSYCTEIQTNCTGVNAQYPDVAHCTSACRSFTVGASQVTDRSGNTLGCRIYHAGAPSKTTPDVDCFVAGPAGDRINAVAAAESCAGGDLCASFCAVEIMACGSQHAPLMDDPKDADGNSLYQYQSLGDCVSSCSHFDMSHAYSTTAVGDSLACRLFQAIDAAIAVHPNGAMLCSETAVSTTAVCNGTAMP